MIACLGTHQRPAADADDGTAGHEHDSRRRDRPIFDRPARLRDQCQDQVSQSECEGEADNERDGPRGYCEYDRLPPGVLSSGDEQLAADQRRADAVSKCDRDDGNGDLEHGDRASHSARALRERSAERPPNADIRRDLPHKRRRLHVTGWNSSTGARGRGRRASRRRGRGCWSGGAGRPRMRRCQGRKASRCLAASRPAAWSSAVAWALCESVKSRASAVAVGARSVSLPSQRAAPARHRMHVSMMAESSTSQRS